MVDKGYKQNSGAIMNKQEQVIKLIEKAISEVQDEIQLHKKGIVSNGNELQLQRIKDELIIMKDKLNPQKYIPGYSRIIVDSWDLDSKLGLRLLEVVNKYKKL
ncbi:MAG: hypothetical protein IJO26_02615 [Clostridium sp.]|nr:hypothetical protein [Clostridium sp.]